MAITIEFAVVLLIKRRLEWKDKSVSNPNGIEQGDEKKDENISSVRKVYPIAKVSIDSKWKDKERGAKMFSVSSSLGMWNVMATTDKIDFAALVIFLIAYLIFNFIYWSVYK